jgi:hypothetical protein
MGLVDAAQPLFSPFNPIPPLAGDRLPWLPRPNDHAALIRLTIVETNLCLRRCVVL